MGTIPPGRAYSFRIKSNFMHYVTLQAGIKKKMEGRKQKDFEQCAGNNNKMWKVVWKVCKTFCRSRAKKGGYVNNCGDGRKDRKR